jgi:periplasmic copper chaperone A
MLTRTLVALIGTVSLASAVYAHDYQLGDIQIKHPFARATVPGQTSGAAYLDLKNTGKKDDELVKAESTIAKSVELHEMKMSGDVMKMRHVDDIDVDAGEEVNMQPGRGYHIMLIGLKQPLKVGDKFPLTLTFEKAGKIDVVVNVEANPKTAAEHQH